MTEKRFTTNGYKIYDTFHDGMHWLVNEVEAEDIVTIMNNLDTKARERSKALSKLQKENEQLKSDLDYFQRTYEIEERGLDIVAPMCTIGSPTPSRLELFKENEQLKNKLKGYTDAFDCSSCRYHNYDWFDDGDEFEVCDKGNNEAQMDNHSCSEWEEI